MNRTSIARWSTGGTTTTTRSSIGTTRLLRALEQVAGELANRNGVVEAAWLPAAAAGVLQLDPHDIGDASAVSPNTNGEAPISLGTVIRELRRRKEPDEIALLKQCMAAGDAGQAALREIVKPGISELDVYCEVQRVVMRAAGRPGLMYGDFRATTSTNIKAGGLPTDHVLERGDLFIMDYSVVLDGYRGDFTNTLAVGAPERSAGDAVRVVHGGAGGRRADTAGRGGGPRRARGGVQAVRRRRVRARV